MESLDFRDTTYAYYEEGKSKRQRVSEACNRCRDRKQRCDGQRPVCMPCQSRGLAESCKYSGIRRGGGAQSLTESTDGRTDLDKNVSEKEDAAAQPWSSRHSDGLATFAGRDEPSVFGPSSTVTFLRQVLSDNGSEISALSSQQTTAEASQKTHGNISELAPERVPEGISRQIPERNLSSIPIYRPIPPGADDLIECYWSFVHPVFPVLHTTQFNQQYYRFRAMEQNIADRSKRGKRLQNPPFNGMFMAIMNLVFALGCKFSNYVPDAEKASTADVFYQNSRELSYYNALDSATLESAQMLVLTGVYLQSTRHAERCWNTIGLAIRVAQGLGLDSEPDNVQEKPQLQREMNRRIWHTCVNLDRLLAMTFGRPTMIHKADQVPLPAMIDDEHLLEQSEGQQPNEVPSRLGLFVSSCTLLELLGEVLELHSAYDPVRSRKQLQASDQNEKLVTRVMDLNRRLDAFSANVPDYLKENNVENPHSRYKDLVKLQKHVLLCRFLLIRLLLLRTLLLSTINPQERMPTSGLLNGTEQSMLDNVIIQQSCEQCLFTSYRLIDTVYFSLDTPYHSSGWHSVYFTFSSAIILLASLRCNMLQAHTGHSDFEAHWERSLLILEHYRDRVQSAGHAITSLKKARACISQNASNQGSAGFFPTPPVLNSAVDLPVALVRPIVPPTQGSIDDPGTDEFDPYPVDGFPELYLSTHTTDLEWLQLFQWLPNVS